MSKKQTTKYHYQAIYADGTFIKAGWVYNKYRGTRADKIRLKIKSANPGGSQDFLMRKDEALCIINGLSKILTMESLGYFKK